MTTPTAVKSNIRPIVVPVTDSAKTKDALMARELDSIDKMLFSLIGELERCEADADFLGMMTTNIASV